MGAPPWIVTAIPDGGITPVSPAQYSGVTVQASWPISFSNQLTLPVTVQYAGAAPLEIEGVGQINFVVPATPAGVL